MTCWLWGATRNRVNHWAACDQCGRQCGWSCRLGPDEAQGVRLGIGRFGVRVPSPAPLESLLGPQAAPLRTDERSCGSRFRVGSHPGCVRVGNGLWRGVANRCWSTEAASLLGTGQAIEPTRQGSIPTPTTSLAWVMGTGRATIARTWPPASQHLRWSVEVLREQARFGVSDSLWSSRSSRAAWCRRGDRSGHRLRIRRIPDVDDQRFRHGCEARVTNAAGQPRLAGELGIAE